MFVEGRRKGFQLRGGGGLQWWERFTQLLGSVVLHALTVVLYSSFCVWSSSSVISCNLWTSSLTQASCSCCLLAAQGIGGDHLQEGSSQDKTI